MENSENILSTAETLPINLLSVITKENKSTNNNYDIEDEKNLLLNALLNNKAELSNKFDEEQENTSDIKNESKNDDQVVLNNVENNTELNLESLSQENTQIQKTESVEMLPNDKLEEMKSNINNLVRKHIENDKLHKETENFSQINGNSEYSNDNIPLNYDESSCSSTSSSNSSQNLVIDQQEPPDKVSSPKQNISKENEINVTKREQSQNFASKSELLLENNESINDLVIPHEDNLELPNPLKRKLSNEDLDKVRNKLIHYDKKPEKNIPNNHEISNNFMDLQENNKSVLNSLTKFENHEQIFHQNVVKSKELQCTENTTNNLDKGGGIISNLKLKEYISDDKIFLNNRELYILENFDQQQYNGGKINLDIFQNYETLSEQKRSFDGLSPKLNVEILQPQSDNISTNLRLESTDSVKNADQRISSNDNQCIISSLLQPPLIEPFSVLPPVAPSRNLTHIIQKEFEKIPQLPLESPPHFPPIVKQNYENYSKKASTNKKINKTKKSLAQPVIIDSPLVNIKKKKYFLCSTCRTYHQSWNLFLHMREIHKRHICLYCLGMFPTAEHLTLHLEMKHDLEQNHFDCQDKLFRSLTRDECFLMCCTCEHIFSENDEFSEHKCQEYLLPCLLCGQKGKHIGTCKAAYSSNNKKQKDRTKKKLNNIYNIGENKLKSLNNLYKETNNNNKLDNTLNNINETIKNIIELKSSINLNNHQHKTNDLNKIPIHKQLENTEIQYLTDENSNNNNSIIKTNGYLENSNFDYDLINLYKSNRIAIMKKEQEQQKNLLENSVQQNIIKQSEPINEKSDLQENSNETNIFNDYYNNFEHNIITYINDNNDVINNNTNITSQKCNNNNLHKDNSTNILENRLTLNLTTEKLINSNNESDEIKLVVPKFKLKIPKEYQNNTSVESEHSSTESDTDDGNENDINTISEKTNKSDNLENTGINIDIDDNLSNSFKNNDSDMDIDTTCNSNELFLPTSRSENSATTSENCPTEYISEQSTIDNPKSDSKDEEPQVVLENQMANSTKSSLECLSNNTLQESQQAPNENNTNPYENNNIISLSPPSVNINQKIILTDGIELAEEDTQVLDLRLDLPIDKIAMVQFLRICLNAAYPTCLYCNHARRIAVNGHSLALHILSLHRFSATVDSITAEELLPTTIISKIKSFLPELHSYYFNMNTYCNINRIEYTISVLPGDEKLFECFQCRFATTIHKELYLHNRKMHLRTAILCFMCRSNFYSYSEILCHICPGTPNKVVPFDIKFRCCLCELDEIPSAFRLMVHLRKKHFACDVCLEYCQDQSKLSSHVWKHKLHHLCYRCGIAYRNKPDITKHLFWKHGTESVLCKRCLQKRWPHVYHFCIPPQLFVCDVCSLSFSKAMYLKVHKRLHSGDAPYPCTEDSCDKKFISRKLLLKHVDDIHTQLDNKHFEPTCDRKIQSRRTSSIANSIKEEAVENVVNEKLQIKNEVETKPLANVENVLNNIEFNENKINSIDLETPTKKKKKKTKNENKESLEDLNLPAPNLSESDSSDESGTENRKSLTKIEKNDFVPNIVLSPVSEISDNENENDAINFDKTEGNKIIDIWENFKTFQAQQPKIDDDEFDEEKLDIPVPILHVVQSDHDYCRMFRPITSDKKTKMSNESSVGCKESISNTDKLDEFKKFIADPSTKDDTRNKSDSSSSDSSSSTDSSCSCGSNCSCSSSSNSSSDSSSSNDSDADSSSSEGKRRIATKRAAKREKQRGKHNNSVGPTSGIDNNSSENIDVVTNENIPSNENILPIILEPIVLESDLETDESDTDEDFYDDHPQKLASEILAEKRRLLMQQTSLSPSHNFDIVENSRPSTPSLPEEILNCEKKQKIKKKKRERKASSKNIIPPFKLNIPQIKLSNSGKKLKSNKLNTTLVPRNPPELIYNLTDTTNLTGILQNNNNSVVEPFMSPGVIDLLPPANLMSSSAMEENIHASTSPKQQQIHHSILSQISINNQPMNQQQQSQFFNKQQSVENQNIISSNNLLNIHSLVTATPATSAKHRLSTGSSSDADGSLKRSKRTRRPNRFYGYSSDDDAPQHTINTLAGTASIHANVLFKPTPPPNLTWCKEDLPTPSKSILSNKNYKSSMHVLENLSVQKKQSNVSSFKRTKTKKENLTKIRKTTGSIKNLSTLSTSSTTTEKLSLFPPIPTLKIRPSTILPQVEPSILDHPQTQYHQEPPPVVSSDPLIRVPPVPVHHIEPIMCYPSSRESVESTDSSDEDKLTIPVNLYKTPKSQMKMPKIGGITKSISKKYNAKVLTGATLATPATITSNSSVEEQISPTSIGSTPTVFKQNIPPALLPNPDLITLQYFKRNNIRYPIRPPAGARAARDGESVYCYCRCPYDEVSEMIACDGDNCMIEWFHFECVGIFVAPQGKWFCAECKPKHVQTTDNYQHLSAASASRHYLGY